MPWNERWNERRDVLVDLNETPLVETEGVAPPFPRTELGCDVVRSVPHLLFRPKYYIGLGILFAAAIK